MKFDVVIANPPYQDSDNDNNKRLLWPRFLEFALRLTKPGGYVSFITPNSWASNHRLYNELFTPYNPIYFNMDSTGLSKLFPYVDSTFSIYVIQNCSPTGQSFPVKLGDDRVLLNRLPVMGLGFKSAMAASVLSKTSTGIYFNSFVSYYHHSDRFSKEDPTVSWEPTEEHIYPIYHKTDKSGEVSYFYSSRIDTSLVNRHRVVASTWTNKWTKMITQYGEMTSQGWIHFDAASAEEATILKSVLTSKLYRFILMNLAISNSLTRLTTSYFPVVDLSRTWTDAELYQQFGITEEEIALIESTIN